jgi:hypothetical protein
MLLVVRWLMTKPFIALLPPYLGSCIPQPPSPNPLVAIASITIGACSHIIWDSFTHLNGWFVVRYSFFSTQIGRFAIYDWLQHGCGVLGLIAVALWIAWALGEAKPQHQPETLPLYARFLIGLGIVIMTAIAAIVELKTSFRPTREITLIRGVVGTVSGLGLSFLVYSSSYWLLRPILKNSFK